MDQKPPEKSEPTPKTKPKREVEKETQAEGPAPVDPRDEKIAELEAQVTSLTTISDISATREKETNEDLKKVKGDLERSRAEVGHHKTALSAQSAKTETFKQKAEAVGDLLDAGDAEERLKQRDALKKEVSSLASRVGEFGKELAAKDERIKELEKSLKTSRRQAEHIAGSMETMQPARDAAQKREAAAQAGQREAEAAVAGLKRRITSLEGMRDESIETIKRLEKEVKELTAKARAKKPQPAPTKA